MHQARPFSWAPHHLPVGRAEPTLASGLLQLPPWQPALVTQADASPIPSGTQLDAGMQSALASSSSPAPGLLTLL